MKAWLARRRRTAAPLLSSRSCAAIADDIISRLPIDLYFLVIENLELVDLDAMVNVSYHWRDTMLSEVVRSFIANRHHPGLLEYISVSMEGNKAGAHDEPEALRAEEYRRIWNKIRRRTQQHVRGKIRYEMQLEDDPTFKLSKAVPQSEGGVHSYSHVPDLDQKSHVPHFMAYAAGRMAWAPEIMALPYLIFVDDFRTGERKAYMFPEHNDVRLGYKTSLSDKLLVMSRDRMLHVWHLNLNRRASFEAPEMFERCVLEGERLLLVTNPDAEVYIWRWDTQSLQCANMASFSLYPSRPVNLRIPNYEERAFGRGNLQLLLSHRANLTYFGTPPPGRDDEIFLDFILHPIDSAKLFAVIARAEIISVYEIDTNLGNIITSYHHQNPVPLRLRCFWNSTSKVVRHEKVDSYGGYSLLTTWTWHGGPTADMYNSLPCCQESGEPTHRFPNCGIQEGLQTVCFNIYTRAFTVLRHHPIWLARNQALNIWNGRMASFAGSPDPKNGCPIWSCDVCAICDRPERHIHEGQHSRFATTHERLDWMLQRRRPSDITSTSWRLIGDDDFLVSFEGNAYTVWSFGQADMFHESRRAPSLFIKKQTKGVHRNLNYLKVRQRLW